MVGEEGPVAAARGGPIVREGLAGARGALAAWVSDILVPLIATRAMLTTVGVLAIGLLPRSPFAYPWDASSDAFINAWSRWDGYWYVRVATEGYSYVPHDESSIAFFPLYPLLMRLAGLLVGRTDPAGLAFMGIVISNMALLAAVSGLFGLTRLDFDRRTAARAVLYLLVFPTSLFLSAVYTESLFLALAVAAFYCARTGRWGLAGLLGGAAALTRPHGALIAAPLLAEFVLQRGFRPREFLRRDLLSLVLIPAAVLVFALYQQWQFGDAFAFLHAHAEGWGRRLMPPWETLQRFFSTGPRVQWFVDLASAVLFVVPLAAAWRFLRASYAVFVTVFFVGALSSGTLLSLIRLEVTLFPVFMVLGLAGRWRWFDRAYLIGSSGLAALFMAMFAQWYWVA